MLEFGNTINTLYGASVITSAHATLNTGTQESLQNTQDTITYLLDPVFTSLGQSNTAATNALSSAQGVASGVSDVAEAMGELEQLLEDISEGAADPTEEETAEIQDLVDEINEFVAATLANENEILGESGEDLVFSIGNGSVVTIKAMDLSLSLDGVDLTTLEGAEAYLATITEAVEDVTDYQDLVDTQVRSIGNLSQVLEADETTEIDTSAALAVASVAAAQIIDLMEDLLRVDNAQEEEESYVATTGLDADRAVSLLAS